MLKKNTALALTDFIKGGKKTRKSSQKVSHHCQANNI